MTAGVGTKLWMAPEVMLGGRYSEKADVFSFGVILSELDTHALPYDGARDVTSDQALTDVLLMQLVSQGKIYPRFTRRAHPAIVALARECLQYHPAKRPSASDLVAQLVQISQQDPPYTRTRSAVMTHDTVLSLGTHATTSRSKAGQVRGRGRQ